MKNLQINVEEITPELAAAWVEKNLKNNRPLSPSRADKLAADITNGDWILNGQAIIFDEDGALVNGQHRLEACIRSGKPITSVAVRGVDRLAFLSIDTGQSRTTAQILAIKGKRILRS